MDHIWSPWRMNYIMNHDQLPDGVFCKALQQKDNSQNLLVFRGQSAYLILNRYLYTSGHVMVVPKAHAASLDALNPETRAEMIEMATFATRDLNEVYHPQGYNLGINLGDAAGAGIADHVHLHVAPRWAGDSNFMSAVAGTRVLPEKIKVSYARIKDSWEKNWNFTDGTNGISG